MSGKKRVTPHMHQAHFLALKGLDKLAQGQQ